MTRTACPNFLERGSFLDEPQGNGYSRRMIEDFDPTTIEDERLRQVFISLMNLVEHLSVKVAQQAEEIQRLRDENNRLKGEQGKPKILPNTKANTALSSEKERRVSKPHHKANKHAQIRIDRVEVVKVEKEHLPADAQFKGYEDVIVQDVEFRTENIRFRKEKYDSSSQKKTYLAALPTGYTGQFGPRVRAWVLALYYADGMSEPKILDFLQTVGMSISAGQLSDMLIKDQGLFHAEHAHVVRAGLSSSPWQHLDSTGTRVNGKNEQCHILCNPLYTAYRTLPAKDRMTLLRVLLGGADPVFEMNDLADGPAAQARREGEVVSPASHAVVARPHIHREPPRRGVGSAPAHLWVHVAQECERGPGDRDLPTSDGLPSGQTAPV